MIAEEPEELTPQVAFIVDAKRRVVGAETLPHPKLPQLRKVTFDSPRRASIRRSTIRRVSIKPRPADAPAEVVPTSPLLTRVILWGNQKGVNIKPPWKHLPADNGTRSEDSLPTKSSFDMTKDSDAIEFLRSCAKKRTSKISHEPLQTQSSSPLRRVESEARFFSPNKIQRIGSKSSLLLPKLKPAASLVRPYAKGASTERVRAPTRLQKSPL